MSQEKLKESATSAFTQYLTDHGMRKTPERYAILSKIFDTPGHFHLTTLHSELDKSGYHVSRSTLFNTISLLMDAGLVRRHAFGSESPLYERLAGITHHHLICTRCGKIREVKDPELIKVLDSKRYGKFLASQIDISIYGTCASCQRQFKKGMRALNKNNKN